jgi:hypothetical protein
MSNLIKRIARAVAPAGKRKAQTLPPNGPLEQLVYYIGESLGGYFEGDFPIKPEVLSQAIALIPGGVTEEELDSLTQLTTDDVEPELVFEDFVSVLAKIPEEAIANFSCLQGAPKAWLQDAEIPNQRVETILDLMESKGYQFEDSTREMGNFPGNN